MMTMTMVVCANTTTTNITTTTTTTTTTATTTSGDWWLFRIQNNRLIGVEGNAGRMVIVFVIA
jgi:hypothetical protein